MPQTSGLRALFITTDFPPDIGGLQTYSLRIARDLPGKILAHVAVGSERAAEDLPRPAAGCGFSIHRGRSRARAFLWSFARVLSLRFAGAINLQLHMQWSTAFPSYLLKGLGFRSPYLVLIHGAELLDPGRPLLNFCKAALLARADAVVAGSAHTAGLFRAAGFRNPRVETIPYGNPLEGEIDPAAPLHRSYLTDPAGPRLLCLHRLVARKGTALLLEALSTLTDKAWSLAIVGAGEERERLQEQARELGLAARTAFHPPVDAAEKIRLLSRADLFILPSLPPRGNNHVEGLGLTLLEAQSLGTPVLAAATGGIPEALAAGRTGLLFAAGDAADLRAKLGDLLSAPEKLPALGRAGPAFVAEHFSWTRSLERLAALMREIAG